MIEKIKDFLLRNNYNGEGLTDYLTDTDPDSENEAFWCAATTSKTSGIVQYMDVKYYFYCIAPWLFCPDGRVEVEVTR